MRHIKYMKMLNIKSFLVALLLLPGMASYSQELVHDTVPLCLNGTCDTLYIGKTTLADVEQLLGEGKVKTRYAKFKGNTKKKIFKKVEYMYYEKLKMRFDFETGYKIKSEAKETSPKLRGVQAESGCAYYLTDSISLSYSKARIESLVKSSDSGMNFNSSKVPVYFYANIALQVRYSDDSDDAKIEWLYIYESNATQRKNIAITNKWLKEKGIKK